ncbi:hypothetical protein QAD02_007430 [Eretmocerus hayati]|uniref:Uncharacterized protein n=1 Tax=Eretmocerus hayati TaxID=131215 RepID=A0ACC2N3N1_9HYME|nr:hypothetical protein QAD02_007430 [Eretmocerus hayati]
MCVFVAVVGLHGLVQVSRVGGDGDVIRSCIDLCRVQEWDESSSLSRCDVDVEPSSVLGGCVEVSPGMLHCVIRAPPSLVFSCQTRRCKSKHSRSQGHGIPAAFCGVAGGRWDLPGPACWASNRLGHQEAVTVMGSGEKGEVEGREMIR